jgi:hypothetical protein
MPPTDTKTGTKEPRPYRLLYRSIPVMPANSGRFGYLAIPVPVNALRLSRRLRLLLSIIVACKSYSPRLPVRGLSSSSQILPRTLVVLAPSASFLLLPLCCVMATKHRSHASSWKHRGHSMDQGSRFLFPHHFFLSPISIISIQTFLVLGRRLGGGGLAAHACRLLVGCVEGEIEKDVCCQVG